MWIVTSRIPGPVIRSEGVTGDDVVLSSTMSKVGIVFEGHEESGDDDENSSRTANFFYPPKKSYHPKNGLIPSYFLIG